MAAWSMLLVIFGAPVATDAKEGCKTMTENQKRLLSVQDQAQKFEKTLEVSHLRLAFESLEKVDLDEEPVTDRAPTRRNMLTSWLFLLEIIDHHLDPKFNPDDVPEMSVQPPATSSGVVYPPGADPKLIDDPKARAEYEKAIEKNREKTKSYTLQTELRRLNELVTQGAEDFLYLRYTFAEMDQKEVLEAIEKIIVSEERKKHLVKLRTPPKPPEKR